MVLVPLAVIGFAFALVIGGAPENQITPGKDTTIYTGPLDADGLIDYVTIVRDNQRKRRPAEPNAAVALAMAFGPSAIPEEFRDEFYSELGMEALPEEGEYFVGAEQFAERIFERDGTELEPDELLATLRSAVEDRASEEDWLLIRE